jgi:DNA-binding NtrC family response regulator
MIFDAVARAEGRVLSLRGLKQTIFAPAHPAADRPADVPFDGRGQSRLPTLQEAETALISEALERADGNQSIAAGLLGLSRQALNKRLSRRKVAAASSTPCDIGC